MIRVLSRENKQRVYNWAQFAGHVDIAANINLEEDLVKYSWSTGDVELQRERWSTHPAYEVWQQADELVQDMPDHPIAFKIAQMKAMYQEQEEVLVNKTIHGRFDTLDDTLESNHEAVLEDMANIKGSLATIHHRVTQTDAKMVKFSSMIESDFKILGESLNAFGDAVRELTAKVSKLRQGGQFKW
jgi:hypothetical protein